jgi:hypothetical protein
MGREGKVASPALRGNVNPRLLRHKLVYTTLSSQPSTQSRQNCIPAGRRRGPQRRPRSPPRLPSGSRPALVPGPRGAAGPAASPARGKCKQIARRWSWRRKLTAARAGRRVGALTDGAPDARAQTGRCPPPGRPLGMRAYQTGMSPQPAGCTSLTAAACPVPAGPGRALTIFWQSPAAAGEMGRQPHAAGRPPVDAQQAEDRRAWPSPGRERAGAAVRRWRRPQRRGRVRR